MSQISVVLTTYNRRQWVGKAMASVLGQTFQDLELILVDDGSRDGTEALVRDFSDRRIRYIRHDHNRGAAAAKNTGIRNASCDLIAFQDSDDESLPSRLEEEYRAITSAEDRVGLVYSKMLRRTERGAYLFPSPVYSGVEKDFYFKALRYGVLNISTGTMLARKQVFEKAGFFDERIRTFSDLDFLIRASRFFGFFCVRKPLVIYQASSDSVCEDHAAGLHGKKRIFCTYFRDIKRSDACLARHFQEIGHSYMLCGDARRGSAFLRKAWFRAPLDLRVLGCAVAAWGGATFYMLVARAFFRTAAFLRSVPIFTMRRIPVRSSRGMPSNESFKNPA